jgi:hypothetical protein
MKQTVSLPSTELQMIVRASILGLDYEQHCRKRLLYAAS